MYANPYGQASPQSGLSNNPFVEDPTTAHARFPDLTASSGYATLPQQYPQQYDPSYGPGGPYQAQPQGIPVHSQFTSTSYIPQYPAHPQISVAPQPTGISAFQPSSGFAQYQHQQYPVQPGYPMMQSGAQPGYPQQLQTVAAQSYLAEFDPFARQTPSRNQTQWIGHVHTGGVASSSSSSAAPQEGSHPRDLIRTHKSGLEAWDTYSWKQLFSACDALKEAWSARKQQAESIVRQYGGHSDPGLFGPDLAFGYDSQVEGWKHVLRDANDNFDTVAACTFQLHEVFNSYRQSGDQASKRRVRESCNAAVKGLPDWPSS